jgi:hypothetical protein
MTYEQADRELAQSLRRCAEDTSLSLGKRLLARVLARAVDQWVNAGMSGRRVPELVTYGNHGGVGWGGDLPPVDALDACFRDHDRAYDRCPARL